MGKFKAVLVVIISCIVYFYFSSQIRKSADIEGIVAGQNVLITGASSGIGEQMAYQYAQLGANIFITARRASMLKKTAVKELGGLDVIVLNHANIAVYGFWLGTKENITNLENTMQSTFTSHVLLASDSLPYLQKTNGSIAVVSSINGAISFIPHAPYNTAKHAIEGFFRTLRSELMYRDVNVSITMFVLGCIDTAALDEGYKVISDVVGLPPEFFDKHLARANVEDTAREIITSTALRKHDVWYPPNQRLWWVRLLQHLWPELVENPENFFPKAN